MRLPVTYTRRWQSLRRKKLNMNRKNICLIIVLIFTIGCQKENSEFAYKISSLVEIINGDNIDKTNEIITCRVDDEFFFSTDNEFDIREGESDCSPKLSRLNEFTYSILKIDSLNSEFVKLEIPGSLISYNIHDSLRLTQTAEQWRDNESQLYKIIEFNETNIILQTADCLSKPKTQNIWQIHFIK